MQGIGMVTTQAVASATLALVALLATSEIVERQTRLSRLEKAIEEQRADLNQTVDNLTIKKLVADECYEYVRYLFLSTKKSIYWVSAEPRRGTTSDSNRPYESAIDLVLKRGNVRFTWLTCFDGESRIQRATRILSKQQHNPKVYIGFLPKPINDIPSFSYFIFDEITLVTRAPFSKGELGAYLVITSPTLINLFIDHFRRVLEKAIPLDTTEKLDALLKETIQHTEIE
jgi:hypothetical protein